MEFNVLIILWLISTMAKTIEGNGCVSTNAGKCQKAGSHPDLCLPEDYNVRNPDPSSKPLLVNVTINVAKVVSILEGERSLWLKLLLQVRWQDCRVNLLNQTQLYLDPAEVTTRIFMPELYVYDFLEEQSPSPFGRSTSTLFIDSNNYFEWYRETSIKIFCPMNFSPYPLDTQYCDFLLGSVTLLIEDVTYLGQAFYNTDQLQHATAYEITFDRLLEGNDPSSSGNYSTIGLRLKLKRLRGPFLIQTFMPSIIFIFTSWISFLMQPGSVDRTNLLITVLLVIVAMFLSVVENLPRANTPTAIEVWMVYCIISTFLILLQNGLVMLIARQLEEKIGQKHWSIFKVGKPKRCQRGPTREAMAKQTQDKAQNLVQIIDKISFGVCVACLLIFSLVFWTVYAD